VSRKRDHPDDAGVIEGTDMAAAAESGVAFPTEHNDVETADLSDTGIGLSVGEPNTFEPEEAGLAAD
jgi:hypothetical protein